ncbi:nitroreductase family deazaflavin-dependent oxidoreductase [Antribacter sp. KLBMP9083]|uniref:Nitroreductase family deazaflavin-dependent oxidoreductase n=1 Tax=Antribacter soli TaxID=2910976 RepID=A0AA41QEL4_9MICO|nr:nitroreductase/quinone reductase family protein [Antribacter soli]MCF4121385.1 nitroreductase family deazaflavin-dependent oxidoreductase [Antribacter soli]
MSFTHPTGTRGARQPGGRAMIWANKLIARRARRNTGKTIGMNLLVLTTIGRKSGQPRETPLGWFQGRDGSWLIVASAGGAPGNPAWYLNLAANPDQVTVELAGQKTAVTAEELHGAEREEAWQKITSEVPQFARYQVTTDRELPVIRLTPRPS